MFRSSLIPSYLLSGAIHASVVGLAYVSIVGGYVPPGYGMRSGGTSGAGGTIWSPQLDSPFELGEVVELKGDDGQELGLAVTLIDPTAAQLLEPDRVLEMTVAVPEPSQVTTPLPVSTPASSQVSLPELPRLPEPGIPEPKLPLAETQKVEPTTLAPADLSPAEKTESVTPAKPETQPTAAAVKEQVAKTEKAAEKTTKIEPASVARTEEPAASGSPKKSGGNQQAGGGRPSTEPPPQPEQLPVRNGNIEVAKREGDATSGKLVGNSDGHSLQGVGSAASQPSPGSGLPPGARPDQYPTKLPSNPAPPYPNDAYQMGHQGTVLLLVTVNADGTVSQVKVHRSSGYESLDKAALETVERWKFQAATYLGRPVRARVYVPVGFAIQ